MSNVSETTKQVSELSDLELLLDVGFALRSIPEEEIPRWLSGNDCLLRNLPHKDKIKYQGQPVFGMTKEYDVSAASGQPYRLVVHPEKTLGVQNSAVRVKFSKTYEVGENKDLGSHVEAKKNVLYLLPLVAQLPLKDISYEKVRDFFEKNNGFVYDTARPEMSQFRDSYQQKRDGENVWMDVYVTIHNLKDRKVKVDLEVVVPKKRIT